MIYALYTLESVGERNVDKIPAQQGSYLNKEARYWMEKKTRAYPGFGGSVHVTCIRRGSGRRRREVATCQAGKMSIKGRVVVKYVHLAVSASTFPYFIRHGSYALLLALALSCLPHPKI